MSRINVYYNASFASTNSNFISTWDTTQAGSASDTIVLPMTAGVATVDWGDGTTNTSNTHTYTTGGIYTLIISGTIEGFRFASVGDRIKITDVSNWGTFNITTDGVFSGCSNLDITATDAPTITTTSLFTAFSFCSIFNGNISSWDISNVIDMNRIFETSFIFNQPLNSWDVSNVTSMVAVFRFSFNFNQPLNSWDVSSVTDTNRMFESAFNFNQPLNSWDVSSVTDMFKMFQSASSFDQDISSWQIAQVTNFYNFMSGVTLSTTNYDLLLVGWESQAPTYSGSISFGNSTYTLSSAAETARTSLINTYGWTISDGGGV